MTKTVSFCDLCGHQMQDDDCALSREEDGVWSTQEVVGEEVRHICVECAIHVAQVVHDEGWGKNEEAL